MMVNYDGGWIERAGNSFNKEMRSVKNGSALIPHAAVRYARSVCRPHAARRTRDHDYREPTEVDSDYTHMI